MTDETIRPNHVDSDFRTGRARATCGVCGDRTKSMGFEQKALTAIADHRRDKHPESQ